MPSKKAHSQDKPKRAKRGSKPKAGAVEGERLKPISLHGMEFDEVIRRLIGKTRSVTEP
jgi:hypothetical protein